MDRFVVDFHTALIADGKSDNTANTYVNNAQLFVDWLEGITGETFDGKITTMDTNLYSRYLSDTKKQSLNTINTKLNAVHKFAQFLSDSGMMQPITVSRKKGTTDPDVEVLEKNELYKFLRYVLNSGNKLNIAVITLLLNTGIRESELCALELSDIQITDRKGILTVRSGKGNKFREVPLNRDARIALTDYIQNGRPETDSENVFIGQRGALTRNAVYKIVAKAGERALGKSVYPHMLRHQCFTAMAKNPDVDLKTISSLAGHSSVELTTRYYINSSKTEKINAVENLSFF